MKTLRTAIVVALVSASLTCRLDRPMPRKELRRRTGTSATSGTAEFAAGVAVGADSRPVVARHRVRGIRRDRLPGSRGQIQQRHRRANLDICRRRRRPADLVRGCRNRDRRRTATRSWPLPSAMRRPRTAPSSPSNSMARPARSFGGRNHRPGRPTSPRPCRSAPMATLSSPAPRASAPEMGTASAK